jgi:hypothetical protein
VSDLDVFRGAVAYPWPGGVVSAETYRADVTALLAEVDRLRARVNELEADRPDYRGEFITEARAVLERGDDR